MPLANTIQGSFNAGELDEHLAARTDFGKYASACETVENLICLPEGGLTRRAGTRYIAALKSSAVKGRLMTFQFSDAQAYGLEFADQALRFFRHQGQIIAGDITAAIANGAFDSGITSWTDRSGAGSSISHDATNNRLSLVSNGTTNAHAEQQVTNALAVEHVLKFRVFGAPGDKIKLRVGTTSTGTEIVDDIETPVGFHAYAFTATAADFYVQFLHGNGKTLGVDDVSLIDDGPVEIDTPWTEAQLFDVNGPQSLDELYLFHPSHPTYKLQRFGHTNWALVEVAWQDGPWLANNEDITATTLTPSAATGLGITITASATDGINDGDGFKATDVGRLVRIDNPLSGIDWGWAVITSVTSATVVVADVKRDFGATTADVRWRLGAWSGTTGYPSTGGFYEQRLFAANTTTKKQTFWASQTGDFENQSPDSPDAVSGNWDGTVEDDDALDYTLSADNAQPIVWLSPGENTLAIGTKAGEWTPTSNGAVLTPVDIRVSQQTTHGSAAIQPVRVGHVVLFVQKAKRKVREFGFSFEVDGYRAFDMTRLSRHVTRGGIVEMGYAEEPNSLVWAVRQDGQLLSMTFRREEDVVGWTRHVIGGSFSTGDAVVESVTVIPGDNGSGQTQDSTDRDEVWLIVKRTIDGATKRYVEMIEGDWETGDAQEDAYYADSCITLDAPITISGATAADPVVVTATSHGLAAGDEVRIGQVLGMTELNGNSYRIADVAANTFALTEVGDERLITGATAADPVVITSAAHGYADGDMIGIHDVSGMTEINGLTFKVANKTADTFELNTAADATIDGTGYTAYVSGGKIYHAADGTSFTAYDSAGQVREKVAAISGLGHLEGETIKILADGAVHPDRTVSSGAVTLDDTYSVVHMGLGYAHKIKTLKLEAGAAAGTAVAKIKQIFGVTFVVLNSHTLSFGREASSLTMVDFRAVADAMDTAVPYFTGERFEEFDADWETDARMVIESDAPTPFTLLALAPEITTRDV